MYPMNPTGSWMLIGAVLVSLFTLMYLLNRRVYGTAQHLITDESANDDLLAAAHAQEILNRPQLRIVVNNAHRGILEPYDYEKSGL